MSGIEVWSFSRDDLIRRARGHLNLKESQELADDIVAARKASGMTSISGRPFEPSGASFSGVTATERDDAFGRSLEDLIPLLAKGQIWTLAEAEAASLELRAIPLSNVKTGLIFDPLSRDPFKLPDGPLLGDWIPDIGLSERGLAAMIAIEQSSTATGRDLVRLDAAIEKVEGRSTRAIVDLARFKRLSLIKLTQSRGSSRLPLPTVVAVQMPEDPIWAVGNFARMYSGMTPQQLGMTSDEASTAGVELDAPMNLNQMALSWFWVGWTLDPSLQHSSLELKAKSGQYMAQALWDAGPYPWHAAYFAARRPVEERREIASAFQPEINAFVNEEVLARNQPQDPRSQRQFVLFCANVLRMQCMLMEKDIQSGRPIPNPFAAKQQMNGLLAYVRSGLSHEDAERTSALVKRCLSRLKEPQALLN